MFEIPVWVIFCAIIFLLIVAMFWLLLRERKRKNDRLPREVVSRIAIRSATDSIKIKSNNNRG